MNLFNVIFENTVATSLQTDAEEASRLLVKMFNEKLHLGGWHVNFNS